MQIPGDDGAGVPLALELPLAPPGRKRIEIGEFEDDENDRHEREGERRERRVIIIDIA